MLFNSFEYLLFFVGFFCLFWFVFKNQNRSRNLLILISSYIFYGWWDWRFLSLIIISSALDYVLGKKIYQSKQAKQRKALLFLSLLVNLGFLGFFKYYNFFIESLSSLLLSIGVNTNLYTLNIILPVGISFYTFQTLSYTLDIYHKRLKPCHDPINFFAFVSFFPQLVAGPIERASNLLPQFSKPKSFNYKNARSGGQLILWGFFKKVAIADQLALLVDTVYNTPESYVGFPMLLATLFFAVQIYCDFSGYSDIAIGTARLFGFNLMTNFRSPYFSKSLTEFWRRWHISLSTWFRDYVYIPLGGGKVQPTRVYINIMLTFVLSGLWHGANWTFVIWGALHGLVLIIEKLVGTRHLNIKANLNGLSYLITLSVVCIGWIFFRSESLTTAIYIIKNIFNDVADYGNFLEMSIKFRGIGLTINELMTAFASIIFLFSVELANGNKKIKSIFEKKSLLRYSFYSLLIWIVIFNFTKNNAGNFIYFQF